MDRAEKASFGRFAVIAWLSAPFDRSLQRVLDEACLTQDRLAVLGSFGLAQRPARFSSPAGQGRHSSR
ncbi:hypothetical protein RGCCGE502_17005 [Rhizobium grahamii CCGE 502]|uniref:Uncharacterized protein n=1 Tax=Rhizobium grahamii CCGE 502 TaxID=990285 RepID=S3ID66_9HYPH|nr:hypothetical protein RGCCGE502_17005 [Rhizobium grahamii CCGE 502]